MSLARFKNETFYRRAFSMAVFTLALASASQASYGVDASALEARDLNSTPSESSTSNTSPNASRFKIGDRLKITFYERLVMDGEADADWKRSPNSDRSFHQRMDISGEYTVGEDGTIAIPILGAIHVVDSRTVDVTAVLGRRFEQLIGRVGFINIVVSEQRPIYIVGPVKNPGVYKFTPGITVMHAVALAGGFDRGVDEIWHLVEAVREKQESERSLERLKRLLARQVVLRSQQDGTPVTVPQPLIDMTNETEAQSLVDAEKARQETILQSQQAPESTFTSNIENLKKALAARRTRIAFIDTSVAARNDRLGKLRQLHSQGNTNNYSVVQGQSDLSDAQERRQDLFVSIADSEAALNQAEHQKEQDALKNRLNVQRELTSVDDEITELTKKLASGAGLEKMMRKIAETNELTAGGDTMNIELTRQSPGGNYVISAEMTTELEAGDLVRIRLPDAVTASHPRASTRSPLR